jgi:thiosulfate/3-mercaptopyruvate sulfurtransferase
MERERIAPAFPLAVLTFFALICFLPQCQAQFSDDAASQVNASSIPQSQLIQPDILNRILQAGGIQNPLVLQVGSRVMYNQAHIPGSIYAGPGSQPDGLKLLENMVSGSPKSKFIVLYCGCCPWTRCPNVGPSYKRLHDLGFNNVKVLYLANNFGDDWLYKGYRVEQGE